MKKTKDSTPKSFHMRLLTQLIKLPKPARARIFPVFETNMDRETKISMDKAECDQFLTLCNELKQQALVTRTILQDDKGNFNSPFAQVLDRLQCHLDTEMLDTSRLLYESAHQFDFRDHRANGYRSFLTVTGKCCTYLLAHLRKMKNDGAYYSWMMMGTTYANLQAYVDCLGELRTCLLYLTQFQAFCPPGSLFPTLESVQTRRFQELIDASDTISQEVFYGRCIGFHYCPSARRVMKVLGCVMAGFSSSYEANKSGFGAVVNTIMKTVSSYWDQEDRGRQIAYITRHASVTFAKSFWNFSEHPILLEAPNVILPPVEIASTFGIPVLPFSVTVGTREVSVPLPGDPDTPEHKNRVRLRLISLRRRRGTWWVTSAPGSEDTAGGTASTIPGDAGKEGEAERSPYLLVHIHGGGFVAQSAKAHDVYLRQWADELDCPIVSVDYSHAPEFPFPRALNECVYAYCWAVKNARKLGSTGQRVIICGDSAGGNLTLATSLKLASLGLPPAHGLMLSYTPTLVSFTPSPSRLLSTMDPLLPVGILSRCLLAYAGVDETKLAGTSSEEGKSSPNGLSPVSTPHSPADAIDNCLDSPVENGNQDVVMEPENVKEDTPISPVQTPPSTPNIWERLISLGNPMSTTGGEAGSSTRTQGVTKSSSTPNLKDTRANSNSMFGFLSSTNANSSPQQKSPSASQYRMSDDTAPLIRVRQAKIPQSPYMSPMLASDELMRQLPQTYIVACAMDPLLDDCVELAKRLESLDVPTELRVLHEIPHGFLNLVLVSQECRKGSEECVKLLKKLFGIQS